MDTTYQTTEEDAIAARQRFESFRLGKGFPSQAAANHTKPAHVRSHSRNTSISSSAGPPSTSNRPATDPLPFGAAPSKRPNSHHRRRSSVSTRRESAEMMGVTVPDLPASLSDDSIHVGDKDSVRRRALWALEGKPDMPYSKVEIPELSALENEKKVFEFPTKPSFPPGTGTGYPMMGKRDSFKLLASSSSSKDPLHTLVEEEEEDEPEAPQEVQSSMEGHVLTAPVAQDSELITPAVQAADSPSPSAPRPRPMHLKLRPLSLTPENLGKFQEHGLPTPPTTASSLKSSPFNPSCALKSFLCTNNGDDSATKNVTNNMRRLSITPSTSLSSATLSPGNLSPAPSEQDKPKRRSSISYKTSHYHANHAPNGLPTPESTPTSERRQSGLSSASSLDDESSYSRPLSASEQHFLFKSHQALLARINDLERGFALRNRPSSCTSESSSHSASQNGSEPTDEMLQLVADLKAERDELKRDVDGWRTRVSDLENHIGIYAKRVEAERRDAWVVRSRVTLLDVEKSALEKSLDEKTRQYQSAMDKCDLLKSECGHLQTSLERMQVELNRTRELEEECCQLRTALLQEKARREDLQMQLRKTDPLATPTAVAFSTSIPTPALTGPVRTLKSGLGFESMDSESSTDVESYDDSRVPLKTVVEGAEDLEDTFTDEEDELARYEDEEESDMSFRTGSSIDSMDDIRRLRAVDVLTGPSAHAVSSSTPAAFRPTHHSRPSWPSTWTFPKAVQSTSEREEVDRFFNCLDDTQEPSPLDSVPSYEDSKGLFSKAIMVDDAMNDEDMPPFLLPRNVGEEVPDRPKSVLEVLLEEDEEQEEQANDEPMVEDDDQFPEGFEVGGIKITFTPPQADNEVDPLDESLFSESAPNFEDENDENNYFNLASMASKVESSNLSSASPETTQAGTPKHANTPSSIPRAIMLKSYPIVEPFTPPKPSLGRFIPPASGLFTPPSKRGGTTPSFIPQPVFSPLRTATSTKHKVQACTMFIPQPLRNSTPDLVNSPNGSSPKPQMNTNPRTHPQRFPRRSRK